jgi:diphthamide synthase (EF-2-diphthine--ammonia ligase)
MILGTRPGLKDTEGVCSACINHKKKVHIDYQSRQVWLTQYIKQNKTNHEYDCLVAISGGKDSTSIVRYLFENHDVRKALLVNITEEFTHTQTGKNNIDNIMNKFNCDLITFRLNPKELHQSMIKGLVDKLHPLEWLENKIYEIPIQIAKNYGIKLVFYGENSEFEYGSADELSIFHPNSNDDVSIIYMGSIYPYAAHTWYQFASEIGFTDLNVLNEWQRHGQIENYSQVDSIGYNIGVWTKYVKFGFQRVSDMSSRYVRENLLTLEQAHYLNSRMDHLIDPASKRDFCRTIGISEDFFDEMVDLHANKSLVKKNKIGVWQRIDYL